MHQRFVPFLVVYSHLLSVNESVIGLFVARCTSLGRSNDVCNVSHQCQKEHPAG